MILLRRVVSRWTLGQPIVNRSTPRPFIAPKKADANRLNPKTGTKSGWFAGPLLHVPARQLVLCFYRLASAVHIPSNTNMYVCLCLFESYQQWMPWLPAVRTVVWKETELCLALQTNWEFSEYNQQDATFLNLFISVRRSTCFRRVFRPSSGAQNCTYSVMYRICQTITVTCC